MIQLPEEFCLEAQRVMGDERFQQYMESFHHDIPVSIRLNPLKVCGSDWAVTGGEPIPWCKGGFYLSRRPNFTMDPLFHAGCYYVQEAASMFLSEILSQLSVTDSAISSALDMCAAPGGKSTLLRSILPNDCVLYSNEPIRNRANILSENVAKWGYENHLVTNNYPRDFVQSKMKFDLILCDVPCSGEGMFRKDEATISEWSQQGVEKCWRLQRQIVSDAWKCLNEGGILIYSTCTFNTKENEENVRWILSEFDAEVIPIKTCPEWNITGSLLPGFDEPVYRFIPGISRSEGLFMCVLRKGGLKRDNNSSKKNFTPERIHILQPINEKAIQQVVGTAPLSYSQAISFLRGEAFQLPDATPRGIVEVDFIGQKLGLMKNIGSRANNLYPKEWRIKTTHISTEYEAILRHT